MMEILIQLSAKLYLCFSLSRSWLIGHHTLTLKTPGSYSNTLHATRTTTSHTFMQITLGYLVTWWQETYYGYYDYNIDTT